MNCGGLSDSRGPVAFAVLRCRLGPRRRTRLAVFAILHILVLLPARSTAQTVRGTWKRLGPDGGQVLSLATSRDGVLYLGTPDGHVFASTDTARHWELRGRVSTRLDAVVQRLLVDARSSDRLFAAVWFQDPAAGGGIFRSEDAGRTWALAGLGGGAVRALGQSGSQPECLMSGTRTGVFRSAQRGPSWQRISPPGNPSLRTVDS